MKSSTHSAPRFHFPDQHQVDPAPRSEAPRNPEKPPKPAAHEDLCPYCQRALPGDGTSVWGLLQLGLKQLCGAIYMIVMGIIRCLRFAVAGVLCLVGLIGSCCFGLAGRVAHRDDRKLLFRR